tara:strand:+ start:6149 stop:6295 length:147 start_codon:yes stop_codon:yes gene_type:complete
MTKMLNFCGISLQPAILINIFKYMNIEITIGANRQAKRPVNINTERLG